MATIARPQTPSWGALPERWARGLRRRARKLWRASSGLDAASLERTASAFTACCCELAQYIDEPRRERWRTTLFRIGERETAQRLASAPNATNAAARQRVAHADALGQQLESVLARVGITFDGDLQSLPTSVAANDPRSIVVLDWAAGLPSGANVLDVGCGSGRFLHLLAERSPHFRLLGLDAAARPLRLLSPGIGRIAAGALNLPFGDAVIDASFAIESLEHSLRPHLAVAEMLRVLKPGGRLLLIDKNRRWQRACEHEPWERWFDLAEVAAWLAASADVERCEYLPPVSPDAPPELFCLWTAIKRG